MSDRRTGWFLAGGLVVALVLAAGVSRWASSQPDGLEKVSVDEGFEQTATDHPLGESPFADYATSGVHDAGTATSIAGVVGVVLTFVVAGGAAALLGAATRRRARRERGGGAGAGPGAAPSGATS